MDSGKRPVTITLTEGELHAVCNYADMAAWVRRYERPSDAEYVRRVTEKMRVAWVEQVAPPSATTTPESS